MISKRIKALADLIEKDEKVLDIGCDHGYLAVELMNRGHEAEIICSDFRKGPLANARKNLDENGYHEVRTVLSDGAREIDEQVDTAVMAGMGYHTVIHIMTDRPDFFENCSKIIIQINTNLPDMRRWLAYNGYMISDEKIIRDYKYYEFMTVQKGEQVLTEQEIAFGPVLLKQKSPLFEEYLLYRIKKLTAIADRIDNDNPDHIRISSEIRDMEDVLELIDGTEV